MKLNCASVKRLFLLQLAPSAAKCLDFYQLSFHVRSFQTLITITFGTELAHKWSIKYVASGPLTLIFPNGVRSMTPTLVVTSSHSRLTGSNQFVRLKLGSYPALSPVKANQFGCSHPTRGSNEERNRWIETKYLSKSATVHTHHRPVTKCNKFHECDSDSRCIHHTYTRRTSTDQRGGIQRNILQLHQLMDDDDNDGQLYGKCHCLILIFQDEILKLRLA